MNLKRRITSLVMITIFVVFIIVPRETYAEKLSEDQKVTMGIQKLMSSNDPQMGYGINQPGLDNGAYIWNIVKYDSSIATTYTQDNIYCVKAGVGFTTSNGTERSESYDVFYNMKTERDKIKAQNAILSDLVDGTVTGINRYNAILAILDRLYLPGESTENEKKELIYTILKCAVTDNDYLAYRDYGDLLEQAFDLPDDKDIVDLVTENTPTKYALTEYALTDNDIKAIQQAVLWYFTNSEENKYDKTSKQNWLHYTLDGNDYSHTLNEYTSGGKQVGLARNVQAEILYNYLIKQAKANANSYANSATNAGDPVKVDTTILKRVAISDNNCMIGPIHMTQLNSTPYTIDFKVKNNGTEISNYQLLDEDQKAVVAGTTVKDLVGKNFYISVPKNQVDTLTIDIKINYNDTTMKLWASSTNNQEQPLVEIHRTNPSVPVNLTLESLPNSFDLKLIKRITEVNGKEVPERIKSIDVSKLNIVGTDSKTTADYQLNEEPVGVAKGDIVTYALRVYNEGTIDGYAQEITEDVPEGLQFLWSEKEGEELKADETLTEDEKEAIEFNQKYLWGKFVYDDDKEKITKISTNYLDRYGGSPAPENGPDNRVPVTDNLIKAFGHNDGTKTEEDLDYKEIYVKFKVVSENITGAAIRNEAAITEDTDENGEPVDDRDSHTDEWHEHPDHEDDEDHDYIILQSFDLALRKFIIAVSNDTKIENNEYLKNEDGSYTRAPVVDTSELNTEDETGKLITTAKYNHTKEPVIVSPNAIVVYMLRVYNEGDADGYASEIKDHLPPYLEYVDDEFNKKYGWEVSEDGRTVTTKYLAQDKFLINKAKTNASGKIELSYQEVPIMCKVKENAKTSENITNIADITEYLDKNKQPAVDRDSQEDNVKLPEDKDLPEYKEDEKGSYVLGQQDDDDFEKVVVKIFDLALRKWVTQAIVIENGQQKVTQTGHDAWDEPEAVVKVELHKKKLDQVTVKFRYSIRVYNQGEIEGYAKEITDYIPEGLKFVAEDNEGWKDEGNNVISTRLLENTLLQPGEYADLEVLLTWVNNENNMGVMNNIAEISEDYNEYGVPDIDSTPDNKKEGEDDIDDAPVMLSISTGQMRIYFTLGFIILITTASGIILIKKFVL